MKRMLPSRIKVAGLLVALYFACAHMLGCSRSTPRVVAVIPRLSSDAQWLSLHVGIVEAAQRSGLDAHWSGPSEESSTAEQIELIQQAIEDHVYGIIFEPSALVAANNVVRKAQSLRIPVVMIAEGTGLPEGEHLYQVANDTVETGNLIAKRIRKIESGDGEVAILGLRSEIPGNIERADAIGEALKRLCPNLKVERKGMESSSISYEQRNVRQFIRDHPQLKVIVALSAQESYAVVSAIRSLNAMRRIKVIGCDRSMALLLILRAGSLDSLVVQDMRAMGRVAIDLIALDRLGKHAPALKTIEPILVSRENIDSEPVQQALLMHRESQP